MDLFYCSCESNTTTFQHGIFPAKIISCTSHVAKLNVHEKMWKSKIATTSASKMKTVYNNYERVFIHHTCGCWVSPSKRFFFSKKIFRINEKYMLSAITVLNSYSFLLWKEVLNIIKTTVLIPSNHVKDICPSKYGFQTLSITNNGT